MSTGRVIPGRVLGADGDGLAYYCAGNDECSAGQARINLIDKLRAARDAAGAESVRVLLTASGSHKGHRYAVAKAKPYQGQRDGARRPNNWLFLRELLEAGDLPEGMTVEASSDREADDLFAWHAVRNPEFVILTQDKDMRMVPGWHMDWLTHTLFHVDQGVWEAVHDGKVYGRKWFWMQMLHGDTADNIPGLPFYTDGSIVKSGPNKGEIKQIRCGEKSDAVVNQLAQVHSDMGAILLLRNLYETCYGERWLVEMLEQGVLLWMRRSDSLLDLAQHGGPFETLTTHELWPAAVQEIENRTKLNLEDEGRSPSVYERVAGLEQGTLPRIRQETQQGEEAERPSILYANELSPACKEAREPHTITKEDILIPEVCPILGLTLQVGDGCLSPASPSLDRKDPALGYTPGNVWVISHRANSMKNDASPEELIRFCKAIIKEFNEAT